MKPLRDIVEGPFSEWLGDNEWTPWFSFLAALRGERMTSEERRVYRKCTGRNDRPNQPFTEAWVIVGRRGRKSAIAALLGVYNAVYGQWPRAAGETVRVLVVAVSKDQAKIVRGYCEAILQSRPGLARLVDSTDAESITLTNGIVIQCVANSFRSIRGPTVVCAILEECAYYYSDQSANPDKELLRAIRPSMLTVPGALLLGISSPYARRGLLYEKYRKHFGKDGSKVLIWKADTKTMNPQVDEGVIAEAYEDDPVAASAEYGAEFRTDVESYTSREALEFVTSEGIKERAPVGKVRYSAFVDPSGGSADSMTLAIGHLENGIAMLDAVREFKPPFSPEAVVSEMATLLKSYHVTRMQGDRYAGEWPVDRFKAHGIKYEQSAAPKSDIYRDLLPLINSRKVDLLDLEQLINQLANLERRTARSGKDSIDHVPGGHDDVANAVAGCVVSLNASKRGYDSSYSWVRSDPDRAVNWNTLQRNAHIMSGGNLMWWRR